eukprot:CAMPEP_0202905562 /NCGR_PEP_ID=MMETSP1392-20130828/34899_1 /ASSEMBLY_ACC=CAM_ASM_000868 /TAXON_ID=225041 /ORGANISM="Chlamydomonas chlamydogama, Strain SAG 11-48b" /LENGTH=94 /DNA_ID=CAMNT_0049593709 /DNA_START=141 /DNA_END=425 /DNA_ORIENTATION=-
MDTQGASDPPLLPPKEAPLPKQPKSPPPINVPKVEQLVPDDYLFSPGVDTPGHRLNFDKKLEELKVELPDENSPVKKRNTGCLGACLNAKSKHS